MRAPRLIVDDEAPARGELRYLLGAHRELEVVAEAASAAEALALADASRWTSSSRRRDARGSRGSTRPGSCARATGSAGGRVRDRARAVRGRGVRGRGIRLPAQAGRPGAARARGRAAARAPAERAGAAAERMPVVGAAGSTSCSTRDEVHYVRADGDYSRVHTYDRSYLCTSSLARARGAPARPTASSRIHRSTLVNLGKVAGVRAGRPRPAAAHSSTTRRGRSSTSRAARRGACASVCGSRASAGAGAAARGRRRSTTRIRSACSPSSSGPPSRRPRRAPRASRPSSAAKPSRSVVSSPA